MRIVDAGFEIIDEINGEAVLQKIERIARVCYKSEDKIKEGSAEKMIKALVSRGHEANETDIPSEQTTPHPTSRRA